MEEPAIIQYDHSIITTVLNLLEIDVCESPNEKDQFIKFAADKTDQNILKEVLEKNGVEKTNVQWKRSYGDCPHVSSTWSSGGR